MIRNYSEPATVLGTELARARRHRHLTQRALAEKAGIGRMTLANLEAGRGSIAALVAVLRFLEHRFADQPADVELGRWTAQSRKSAGLSQEKLCALAGISKPAIVRVERGEGHVTTLVAAMDALDLSRSLVDVAIEVPPPPLPEPTARLFLGDCRERMRAFAKQGLLFDAIVTDPPYHLSTISRRLGLKQAVPLAGDEPSSANPYRAMATGFLGQKWDGGDIAFDADTWRAAYAVLKPGAYLAAFGGSRTFHRLAIAIEEAGFEIRDTVMWLYGEGFPKSHNLKGSHRGRGTALKPAFEPIIIARKPIVETSVASNVVRFGTGAMNIDACRIPTSEWIEQGRAARSLGSSHALMGAGLPSTGVERTRHNSGRWPANLIHDGSPAVLAGFPDSKKSRGGGGNKTVGKTVYGRFNGATYDGDVGYGDEGSTARFFYCAKASQSDRGAGNKHPTVKPNDLMKYLVRLVTPPGGVVLDPFMGSGSTGVAALQEGFSFVGCEMVDEYAEIARRRIAKVRLDGEVVLSDLQSEETLAIRSGT